MNPRPVAFITGASGGIGAAAVQAFAEAGYDVAMLDIEGEGMDAVSSRARAGGAETLTYVVDLSDPAAAQAAMEDTVARWDRIHVLVNNAAWRTHETMRAIELETWERTLRVCLTAPAFLAKCAAKDMEERGIRGAIVNVSSMMSERAGGTSPAYIASKGALDSLTYELAALYGPAGIRVIAVNPGWIDTAMSADYRTPDGESISGALDAAGRDSVPLGRPGTVEEVAKALVWLAGPEASYITGARFLIDGGWTHHHLGYGLKRMQFPGEFP